jgi:hypothetical protein
MRYIKMFENFSPSVYDWIKYLKTKDYIDKRFIDFMSENTHLYDCIKNSYDQNPREFERFFKIISEITDHTFDIDNDSLKGLFSLYISDISNLFNKYIIFIEENKEKYKDYLNDLIKKKKQKDFNL